jgi:hypothetical protein
VDELADALKGAGPRIALDVLQGNTRIFVVIQ